MRSDKSLNISRDDLNLLGGRTGKALREEGLSLSGHERNHLFLSEGAQRFYDASGLSGLDHAGDGRSFATLDYDLDGWQDLAQVNANAPLLQLYRNTIGDHPEGAAAGNFLALRFVGGNDGATASRLWSNRDGIGVRVTITLDEKTISREHRAGEGMAAQNSSTLLVGIGTDQQAQSIIVKWPSGKTQEVANLPAGSLIIIYENPAQSSTGESFTVQPYAHTLSKRTPTPLYTRSSEDRFLQVPHRAVMESRAALRIFTTMATWCVACQHELPQLQYLRNKFSKDEIALFALPVDTSESTEKLVIFEKEYRPAYDLLTGLPRQTVLAAQSLVKSELRSEGIPASIILNNRGRILRVLWGPPSISDIRELLRHQITAPRSPR